MIALPLALLAGAPLLQEPTSPAHRHPANPIVYIETPDVSDVLVAYEAAPIIQMINDPEVRAAVSELLGSLEFDLAPMLDQIATKTGIPPTMLAAPGEMRVNYLSTVASVSASVTIREATPGEFGSTLIAILTTHGRLSELRAHLAEHAASNAGAFPDQLAVLAADPAELEDGWGRGFEYRVFADGTGYELRSLGADGAFGGKGADLDIESSATLQDALASEFISRVGSTVVVEFTTDSAASQAHTLVQQLLGGTPLRLLGSRSLGSEPSATVTTYQIPELWGMQTWTMLHGSLLLLGSGSSAPEAYFDRLAGNEVSAASSAALAHLKSKFPTDSSATLVQGYFSLENLVELAHQLAGVGDENWGEMVRSVKSSVWRLGLDGDRFVSDFYTGLPDPEDKLANSFMAQPLAENLARFVPQDSVIVAAATLDSAALYKQMLASVGTEAGLQDAPTMLSQMEQRYGFSMEHDVFGSIGSGALFYMLPVSGLMSVPGMAVILELEDPVAFQRGLEGLLSLLGDQGAGEFEIKFRPYREHPLWYFTFNQQGGSPIPISPSLVIHDNYLIVTLTSLRAKKEIKRLTAEPGPLHPLFSGALPEGVTAAAYMDWGTLGEGVYTAGRAMLSLVGMGGELPFDLTLLPEAEIFTHFFEPTIAWSRWEADAVHTHLESSFGPETLGGVVAGGVLVAAAMANNVVPQLTSASQSQSDQGTEVELEVVEHKSSQASSPKQPAGPAPGSTKKTLGFLTTRLVVFKLEKSRYPAKLEALLEPTENYPRGFLGATELPTDEWGRAFVYKASEDGSSYKLWSIGADGADQAGEGDDLTGG